MFPYRALKPPTKEVPGQVWFLVLGYMWQFVMRSGPPTHTHCSWIRWQNIIILLYHTLLCLNVDIFIQTSVLIQCLCSIHREVDSVYDVMCLVQYGLKTRRETATLIHDHSSRSHLVVTLTVNSQAPSFFSKPSTQDGKSTHIHTQCWFINFKCVSSLLTLLAKFCLVTCRHVNIGLIHQHWFVVKHWTIS